MNSWILVLGIGALLGSALVGGIFFAFSSFVMKALSKLPSADGIRAMQSINVVVINPLFLGVFFATAILSIGLAVLAIVSDTSAPLSHWFLVGGLNYGIGTFLVTVVGNVPLNNRLAATNPIETAARKTWRSYLQRWTLLNHVRTAAAMLAAFSFLMGLLQNEIPI